MRHQPGLDGLRGVAVSAVIAFHGGFLVARGAFLSVSLFFTLSGFLITSLLLAQAGPTGTIALGGFWSRRFRRLLPAAWLTLGAVMLGAVVLGEVKSGLRGDLWAALAQVANWRFLLAGQSYGELFHSPSPVLHYWSLAIEEQFYLIYPPLIWGMLRIARGRRAVVGLALAAGAAISFALPLVADLSLDRTYYGTDTRAGEFLAGAVLGVALTSRRLRVMLVSNRLWRGGLAIGGVVALGATVALWITTSLNAPLLTAGGLALVSLLSSVLVLAAMVPGPVNRLVTLGPLQWLGRISYGVYLFHWPALLWCSQDRVGLGNGLRVALATGCVLVLAAASERLYERPIRRNHPGAARVLPWVAPLALGVLVLAPVGLTPPADPTRQIFASLERAAQALERRPKAGSVADRRPTSRPVQGAPTYMAFGDSMLLSLVMSVEHWRRNDPQIHYGGGVLKLGCGIVREGTLITDFGQPVRSECREWPTTWRKTAAASPPDFAVVLSCQWEIADRIMPRGKRWLRIGEPKLDAVILDEFLAATDTLHRAEVPLVVWVTCPHFSRKVGVKGLSPGMLQSRDPARVDRLNEIVRLVAARRPDRVRVLEWGEWMEGRVDSAALRPDGSHFAWKHDTGVGKEFGTRLVAIWREWASQRSAR